jgi:hypothetical protein
VVQIALRTSGAIIGGISLVGEALRLEIPLPHTDTQVSSARYTSNRTGNRLQAAQHVPPFHSKSGARYCRLNYRGTPQLDELHPGAARHDATTGYQPILYFG